MAGLGAEPGMEMRFQTLEGSFVRLEPLEPGHKEDIRAVVDSDPAAWSILLVNPIGDGFEEYWKASFGAPATERFQHIAALLREVGPDIDKLPSSVRHAVRQYLDSAGHFGRVPG